MDTRTGRAGFSVVQWFIVVFAVLVVGVLSYAAGRVSTAKTTQSATTPANVAVDTTLTDEGVAPISQTDSKNTTEVGTDFAGRTDIPSDYVKYINDDYRITLWHPSSWVPQVSDDRISFRDSEVKTEDTDIPSPLDISMYRSVSAFGTAGETNRVSTLDAWLSKYTSNTESGQDALIVRPKQVAIVGAQAFGGEAGPNVFGGGKTYVLENQSTKAFYYIRVPSPTLRGFTGDVPPYVASIELR